MNIIYSWQHLLNFFLFQWVGFRLARLYHDEVFLKWCWIRVRPLTGYFNTPFIYWGNSMRGVRKTDSAIIPKYLPVGAFPRPAAAITDHQINLHVAIALRLNFREYEREIVVINKDGSCHGFYPATNWSQAGRIIDRFNLSLKFDEESRRYFGENGSYIVMDNSPLRAVMRAYAKI